MFTGMARRGPYQLKQRAETQADTRRRIIEAAVELHGTVGPARTTISAIAERAGVQRLTVYRHFPTESDLFLACSGHYQALYPPPDAGPWQAIADPIERFVVGVSELYAFYGKTERMWTQVLRDVAVHEPTQAVMRRRGRFLQDIRRVLTEGQGPLGKRRTVVAAINHATDFWTWRSLVHEGGLTTADAVDLTTAMLRKAREGKT